MRRVAPLLIGFTIVMPIVGCDDDPLTPSCAPMLVAPEPGATLDNGCSDQSDVIRWDFEWTGCESATTYHLLVAGGDASVPLIDRDDLLMTSYAHSRIAYVIDANRSDWTWRVRARYGSRVGPWSETGVFDVEPLNTDCPGNP